VAVGVTQTAQEYGPEVVALVGAGGQFDSSTVDRSSWRGSTSAGTGGAVLTEILVTFRAYRIKEELGAYERTQVELAPEFLCFPPWYGDTWRTEQVGGLYSYFFGVGSITDPLTVQGESNDSSRADTRAALPSATAEDRTLQVQLLSQLAQSVDPNMAGTQPDPTLAAPQTGVSETVEVGGGEVPGEAGTTTTDASSIASELGNIPNRSPIGEATEELVRIYSRVKLEGFDVHAFIKAYTWRPIASMVDLFGTANLEIDDHGTVTRGVEGFHSRAFGDFDDLRTLVSPGEGARPMTFLGLTTRDPDETSDGSGQRDQEIAARMDTRKEKRTQVLKYLFDLMSSCGVVG